MSISDLHHMFMHYLHCSMGLSQYSSHLPRNSIVFILSMVFLKTCKIIAQKLRAKLQCITKA